VTLVLLPVLVLFFIEAPVMAQERSGAQGRIEHARWELVGTEVVITYDLIADSDRLYDVSITLRKASDAKFGFAPRSMTGAVGRGVHSGVDNEIRWDYRKDVLQNLAGDDYYFEFVVNVTNPNSSGGLWYYIAGGAAVVGTVAAILIFGRKASEAEPGGLPDPPHVRPEQ
jgi:hypothetical protein